jgi:GTPase
MKEVKQNLPVVTIIGRTNVGKSTIFNRFTDNNQAIVSTIPGTTRDKRSGECYWIGKTFVLTDTAGLDVESEDVIDKKSIAMAESSITEADLVLFVVDGRDGLLPQDKQFAKLIRKSKKPAILVINKVDSNKQINQLSDFQKIGIKTVHPISAKTGAGTGDLLDDVLDQLDWNKKNSSTQEMIEAASHKFVKVSIIGKPNVGKSSLLNSIIGEERSIVSPIPHTTRDSQDIIVEYTPRTAEEPYTFHFVDTAGIIKSRKIANKLQEMSIEQSLDSLEKSDIALLLLDASQDITMQDKTLAQQIIDTDKSIIYVVNKWDLVEDKTTASDKEFIQYVHRSIPFLTWAPIIFISAKTGFKVSRLLDVVSEIYHNQRKEIPQEEIDEFLQFVLRKKRPPVTKGTKPPYIHGMTQVRTNPLTFEITASKAEGIKFPYRRFVQNELRKKYDFMGCGIKIKLTEY